MPTAAFQLFYVLTATFSAGKIRNSRCMIIAILQTVCITGCVMIKVLPIDQKLSRLAGLWLFGAYAAGFPLSLSIIASDVAGFTKKTTVTAILFMGYCAGNIAGPQIFFAREAPGYKVLLQSYLRRH
jgi:MFS transporter, ACS family, allantoate permease